MNVPSLPFDRVLIDRLQGTKEISIEEFLALNVFERVQLVLEGKVAFRRGKDEVRSADALAALRRYASDVESNVR